MPSVANGTARLSSFFRLNENSVVSNPERELEKDVERIIDTEKE